MPFGNPFVVGESPAAPTGNENVNPGRPFGGAYPGLAIDLAQHRFRRNHVLEAIGNIALFAARHVHSPLPVDAAMAYMPTTFVNLDQVNQCKAQPACPNG